MTRYGYGDAGHQFTPDRHGRCQYAGSGYCDGTRKDTQHDERPDPPFVVHPMKPLRASAGRSTTGGGAPRFGPAGLERPADVRRRTSALSGGQSAE